MEFQTIHGLKNNGRVSEVAYVVIILEYNISTTSSHAIPVVAFCCIGALSSTTVMTEGALICYWNEFWK